MLINLNIKSYWKRFSKFLCYSAWNQLNLNALDTFRPSAATMKSNFIVPGKYVERSPAFNRKCVHFQISSFSAHKAKNLSHQIQTKVTIFPTVLSLYINTLETVNHPNIFSELTKIVRWHNSRDNFVRILPLSPQWRKWNFHIIMQICKLVLYFQRSLILPQQVV